MCIHLFLLPATNTYSLAEAPRSLSSDLLASYFSSFGLRLVDRNSDRICNYSKTEEKMLKFRGSIVLKNVKTGVWIADLQLVRCPVCDLDTCDGTMQTLDARHMELFLNEGFRNGRWEYKLIGTKDMAKNATGASGAIFDMKHLNDNSTSKIFNHKLWTGKPTDSQPKAMITKHAVAVNTIFQENNEGFQVNYHVMKSDSNEIVSIRVSQQLV